jgi:hypothetical protein
MLPAANERAEDNIADRILGAPDMLGAIIFNQLRRHQHLPRGCLPPAQKNTRAANAIADGELGVRVFAMITKMQLTQMERLSAGLAKRVFHVRSELRTSIFTPARCKTASTCVFCAKRGPLINAS